MGDLSLAPPVSQISEGCARGDMLRSGAGTVSSSARTYPMQAFCVRVPISSKACAPFTVSRSCGWSVWYGWYPSPWSTTWPPGACGSGPEARCERVKNMSSGPSTATSLQRAPGSVPARYIALYLQPLRHRAIIPPLTMSSSLPRVLALAAMPRQHLTPNACLVCRKKRTKVPCLGRRHAAFSLPCWTQPDRVLSPPAPAFPVYQSLTSS